MKKNEFDALSPEDRKDYLAWLAENENRGILKDNKKIRRADPRHVGKTKKAWFSFN